MREIKEQFKLLIVENDEEEMRLYHQIVEAYNEESPIEIIICPAKSTEEGLKALQSPIYDGAIVDLKLSNNSSEEYAEGNTILKVIKDNLRFPVVVRSGFIQDLDEEIFKENMFFKKYTKTSVEIHEILESMIKIYNTGLTKILGKRGLIDKYINDFFWIHLPQSFKYWVENTAQMPLPEKNLLRYSLLHLFEYLNISDQGGFENYHPLELYIIPPIKKNLFTGDIVVDNSDNYFIILSPSCDLAWPGKVEGVILAQIEKLNSSHHLKNLVEKLNTEKREYAMQGIINLIKNNGSLKYYFLPPAGSFGGGVINFQKLVSVKPNDLKKFKAFATVSSMFVKEITAKFSHYYSRQGQPDFKIEYILDQLTNEREQPLEEAQTC